ncbi:glycogen debranching enzyme [Deinobacterium chartae]|uniref:Glycogen debranching enzyme n=1 Tax=Deinobacterium chartae TaxID=521158 RepID=A0A841I2S5_9DEIO|nr:amylo-alpha-1,6-glucosidase [Deinobacterium chartae]MBB6099314.1 glycogen debranching enzyme [Deinobacterium chartae]
MLPRYLFGHETVRDLTREYLLGDGQGGFHSMSAAFVPTRKYHGLAVSHNPPVQRDLPWLMPLETLEVAGKSASVYALEVAPGHFEGRGRDFLTEVSFEGLLPRFRYRALGVTFERRVMMPRGAGALVYLYDVHAPEGVRVRLEGLFSDRDMHAVNAALPRLEWAAGDYLEARYGDGRGARVRLAGPAHPLAPAVREQRLHYRAEAERGETCWDVVARADLGELSLPPGRSRFALTVGGLREGEVWDGDPWAAWNAEVARRECLVERAFAASGVADAVVATLALSADAFLVERRAVAGHSIIAGYPWFADWGRDAMIALPGLTLPTGRHAEARSVLATFLRYQRAGLLPNNFWDDGAGAGYNTVDGALWLFVALERYLEASGDWAFAHEQLPVLREMLACHVRGTEFGIRVDPADGLLLAGERGVQLTWMDVKIQEWVVTPRHGKAVEICALWIAALSVFGRICARLGEPDDFAALRKQATGSFGKFWNPGREYYFDHIRPDGTPDAALRPNALIALALPDTPVEAGQFVAALRTARRELISAVGSYSLAPGETGYLPDFGGPQILRDAAYHQGTVWAWPMGSYLEALARAGAEPEDLRREWSGLLAHLSEAGVGSVSEVFEAATLVARGCPFQAWSVGELLRVYVKLGGELKSNEKISQI